jgi:hypothetical protein
MESPSLDWQHTLIRIYLFVSARYQEHLWAIAQRQSNNRNPRFTDEEVLTIYLFGIIRKRRTLREIYDYTRDHLVDWFPSLPSYGGYVQRLNRLSAVFAPLIEHVLAEISRAEVVEAVRIVDSMPIMLAGEKRSSQAKVASELADKGYCASKRMFFYGVKLHVVGQRRRASLPVPERVGLSPGSANDLTVLRQVLPRLEGGWLYGDKAYCDGPMKERLAEEQNLEVLTPVKKKKGQKHLSAADKLFSEAVSRVRQPIESLFNWIDEKTGIQCAAKVRSYRGLLVHVFGRLAAAMLLLAFNS